MIRRPPRSTLFPTRRSSDLFVAIGAVGAAIAAFTGADVVAQALVFGTVSLAGIVDRKSTRLNSSHSQISYAGFCFKKKKVGDLNEFVSAAPPKACLPSVGYH